MKRILLVLAVIFSLVSVASAEEVPFSQQILTRDAKKIAVFVVLDPTGVSKPTETSEKIHAAISEKLSTYNVVVVPYEKTRKMLRTYIRENNIGDNARESDLGFNPKKVDMTALAKGADSEFAMYVTARVTDRKQKRGFWTATRQQETILFEILLMKSEADDFIIDEIYSETGSTGGSHERAFNRAITKALEKVALPQNAFE